MNLNSIIFAAPHASYDKETLQEELIWVSRRNKTASESQNVKVRSASQDKTINSDIKRSTARKFSRVYKISPEDTSVVDTQEISTRIQACMQSLDLPDRGTRRDEFDLQEVSFSKPSPNSRRASPSVITEKPSVIQVVQAKLVQENTNEESVSLSELATIKKHYHSHENAKDCTESKPKSHTKSVGCFPFLGRRKSSKCNTEDKHTSKTSALLLKRSSLSEASVTSSKRDHLDESKTPITTKQKEIAKNDCNYIDSLQVCQDGIPCLLLKNKTPTKKYLIYFHANSEDIYLSYDLADHLKWSLKVNVIAGEYPGYGIYKGTPSEKKIMADAELIYQFVLDHFKVKEEDVILFGRSIGSGPAVNLASRHNPGALILMSSFTSVRDIAKDRIGVVGQYLIKNRFKNLQSISGVNSPTLVIHGQKDEVIPHTHAKKLFDACKTKKKIEIRQEMSHNQFDFHDDMSIPISDFLNETVGDDASGKEPDSINTVTKLQAAN